MNKTISININGRYFHIDENAYQILETYLNTLKAYFLREEGGDEIISDVEARVAELFSEKLGRDKEVVGVSEVEFVLSKLGKPEDFGIDEEPEEEYREEDQSSSTETNSETKEKVYDAEYVETDQEPENFNKKEKIKKTIFRDAENRVLGGVCAGLSHYFGIEKLFIRLVFLILTFAGIGFTIPVYIILWAIVPKARSRADKLKMKGEKINVDNIERKVKEEMGKVKDKVKDFASDTKKHQNMKRNFYSMVNEVEPHARKASSGLKKVIGMLLLLGSAFWMVVVLGIILQVPLVIEILAENNWEWLQQVMLFFEELNSNSSAYTIGSIGLLGSVFIPLGVCFISGAKMYFELPYKIGAIIGLLFAGWALSFILLIMAGSMIGFQLII